MLAQLSLNLKFKGINNVKLFLRESPFKLIICEKNELNHISSPIVPISMPILRYSTAESHNFYVALTQGVKFIVCSWFFV
jgi:hypothetical protein